jgi:hypothetical protein
MSEKLLKFLLTELDIVRIRCGKCQAVIEMPVTNLGKSFGPFTCSCCNTPFYMPGTGDPFGSLSRAIAQLASMTNIQVEFVLPDKS